MDWINIKDETPEDMEDVMIWCRLKYRKDFLRIGATYSWDEGWLPDDKNDKIMEVKYFYRYPDDPE
jgi:hypothetical protein